ncbi:MAG TPA: cyclic nucleotide-binding domain-containing protein [Gaiellaceae bacterium]|jgi:CRP-like cAMP-binding protein|nr:cyclic nucleotide-binding domain-containing protein [Gaiellaceae bacterium]
MAEAPVALLSKLPIFAGLAQKDLKHIAEAMTERRVDPGRTLAVEGQQGVGFFVIESGTAKVSVGGDEKRTLGPGDSFGEIALIIETPRTATVTAETEVHCWAIASWAFRPLVKENATVAWALLDSVAKMVASR